jgi:hypothetical protein
MVKPMMNRISETSIRMMPQSCPGVPERMACGGYKVQPEPVGPPGMKKLATRTRTASR